MPKAHHILGAMQILITRFHLLLLAVTVAITGVAFFRVPADYAFAAHWSGSAADWLWPRDALFVAPLLQVMLLVKFLVIGRLLTKNQYAKSQHILDPALTLIMLVVGACQLGLLLTGIGSDLDFIRLTGFVLGAALLVLAVVLFEAERHTYAGLRMPWPISSERAWRWVHRVTGLAFGLAGGGLLALAWLDAGAGALVLGFVAALYGPTTIAGLTTALFRRT
ncbi:SdpI family protein [Devosia sp. SL43]|uniref:SdpI family protein n=1 Tax=Devosia sp. SL43 TaxID=2806348 RepID=UPI001F1EF4E8|nr:SdpI family protein [Devosia sp. SL43]UJW85900.1 SdpI family protein [Devosia sp. SL43]